MNELQPWMWAVIAGAFFTLGLRLFALMPFSALWLYKVQEFLGIEFGEEWEE